MLMFCISQCFAKRPPQPDFTKIRNSTVFLSQPRTGTNWTMASVQKLTGRPFLPLDRWPANHIDQNGYNRLDVQLDLSKPCIYHTHSPEWVAKMQGQSNHLLVILRNYKERTIRMHKEVIRKNPGVKLDHYCTDNSHYQGLVNLIKVYENWPENRRHLFYYEDLLLKPEKTLSDILSFINESDEKLPEFIENIKAYSQQTVDHYGHKRSYSRGQDIYYHTRGISSRLLRRMDNLMRSAAGAKYWSKYFARFHETKIEKKRKQSAPPLVESDMPTPVSTPSKT